MSPDHFGNVQRLTSRIKTDILNRLAEEIYQYKAGSFNGCYCWKQQLKYKMGNYRTHLRLQGCPELSVNSLKAKASKDVFPAKKVKKTKQTFIQPSGLVRLWKDSRKRGANF